MVGAGLMDSGLGMEGRCLLSAFGLRCLDGILIARGATASFLEGVQFD